METQIDDYRKRIFYTKILSTADHQVLWPYSHTQNFTECLHFLLFSLLHLLIPIYSIPFFFSFGKLLRFVWLCMHYCIKTRRNRKLIMKKKEQLKKTLCHTTNDRLWTFSSISSFMGSRKFILLFLNDILFKKVYLLCARAIVSRHMYTRSEDEKKNRIGTEE